MRRAAVGRRFGRFSLFCGTPDRGAVNRVASTSLRARAMPGRLVTRRAFLRRDAFLGTSAAAFGRGGALGMGSNCRASSVLAPTAARASGAACAGFAGIVAVARTAARGLGLALMATPGAAKGQAAVASSTAAFTPASKTLATRALEARLGGARRSAVGLAVLVSTRVASIKARQAGAAVVGLWSLNGTARRQGRVT